MPRDTPKTKKYLAEPPRPLSYPSSRPVTRQKEAHSKANFQLNLFSISYAFLDSPSYGKNSRSAVKP
jgi:hypothetical protein